MIEITVFLILMALGYTVGTHQEKKHYRSIEQRENHYASLPVVSSRNVASEKEVTEVQLVEGSVVIAVDYFKVFAAGLKTLFGGAIVNYETLVDRARREAILRMKQKAYAKGADLILNLRIETSRVGSGANSKRGLASIEAIAYGTAVKFQ